MPDSNGARIVENGPVEGRTSPWRFGPRPIFREDWPDHDPNY